MATPTRWWDEDPGEIYWLEITDRDDLGVDLNAPAERENGTEYWSYRLLREVREPEIIFHYRARPTGAITHWSRAAGQPYADEVVWGAHGQANGGQISPYPRPGWRHALDGPYELPESVSKAQLRKQEPVIRAVHDELKAQHPAGPLYFPFQLSDSRPLRAVQGYLTKFPVGLVDALPQLSGIRELAEQTVATSENPAPAASTPELGTDYRPANPNVRTARREPFSVDPDLVDRALSSHAEIQDGLASAVREADLIPRSPLAGEPTFDLAWEDGETIVVAEIKSLTSSNQEKQLRLALGQVLRYAHLLGRKGCPVKAVIAAEHRPGDDSWFDLCTANGVRLVWPETFGQLF